MENNLIKIFLLAILSIIIGGGIVMVLQEKDSGVGGAFFTAQRECTVTHSIVTTDAIHAQTLLSANSRRLWASFYATTSPVYLGLGATAVKNDGFLTSTSTEFVLTASERPYTGSVSGIVRDTGTTSVMVTECAY